MRSPNPEPASEEVDVSSSDGTRSMLPRWHTIWGMVNAVRGGGAEARLFECAPYPNLNRLLPKTIQASQSRLPFGVSQGPEAVEGEAGPTGGGLLRLSMREAFSLNFSQ